MCYYKNMNKNVRHILFNIIYCLVEMFHQEEMIRTNITTSPKNENMNMVCYTTGSVVSKKSNTSVRNVNNNHGNLSKQKK